MSDPYGDAEASRYDNPVASRKWLLELLEQAGRPLDYEEMASLTQTIESNREGLFARLSAMCRDGQIITDRIGRYVLVDRAGLVSGRVIAHRDGFGFFEPDDDGDTLYLHDRQMRKVFHGDRVLVAVMPPSRHSKSKREARIVEVLQRTHQRLIGRLREQAGVKFVTPEDDRFLHEILIPDDQLNGARFGQFVVVQLDTFPESNRQPVGHVVDVVGAASDPGIEVQVAVRTHDLPYEFSAEAIAQARAFGDSIDPTIADMRVDLRDYPFVTIDGEDARDFDDAVYAAPRGKGGWTLWVAIADVANYVTENSPLDQTAIQRGTSVYFPSEVIPMLPETLSNGLCSLNPQVDRLALAVCLEIASTGRVTSYRFHEVVFQSQQRLTYKQVQDTLDSVEADHQSPAALKDAIVESGRFNTTAVAENVADLFSLYRVLRAARDDRGALDFDSVEPKFSFDEKGKISSVVPHQRLEAHKLIEECMLAANVAAARCLKKFKLPTLYRIHEGPSDERLAALRQFLGSMALGLGGGEKPEPSDYQALLDQAQARPDFPLIQAMILRSMQQAKYAPDPDIGHFGLSYDHYTHFTSPIRRYPDLTVHRLLKWIVQTGAQDDPSKLVRDHLPNMDQMVGLGEHCSLTERRADEASRDVGQWLKCQFMREKLGEEYQGTITGVASFGLFVLLDELFVEGMVHVTQLPPDYWVFSEQQHTLTGERTHQVFRLADSVRVTVARVDLDARRIDFALAGDGPVGRPRRVSVRSRLKEGKIPGKSQSRGRSKKSGKSRR
ncbi:MAG: ribonuclease R [Oceanospirillales bacterium TMED33]|nr:ribonuclease R [Gammaproteobacteria bacterium]RPG20228.1 MAG: ribonuclease R [Oceanospirillales bacterium TMED33]